MPARILRLWNPDAAAWEEVGDSRLTVHQAAADPHPQYLTAAEGDTLFLTPAEGDARYAPVGGGGGGGLATDPLADAKGDLFAASGNDAVGRLPLGTDGQVLTADGAQALGVKWAAAGGGISQADADVRYVNAAGDTMAGALTLAPPATAALYGATSPAYAPTLGGPGNYELGVRFRATTAASLTRVRWYRVSAAQAAPPVRLWDTTATGAPVWTLGAGDAAPLADPALGWKTAAVSDPPALVAGRDYVLGIGIPNVDYTAKSGYTPVPDAPLVFVGHYYGAGGPGTYPSTSSGSTWGLDPGVGAGAPPAAAAGALRLANAANGLIGWRNAANTADHTLTLDASDRFAFSSDVLVSEATPTVSLKQAADTQPRSRLSDTALAFGPGGSTAPDATLQRTGAGALRVDTHLGVGTAVEAGWASGFRSLRVGQTGSVYANGSGRGVNLADNAYWDGTSLRAIQTGAATLVQALDGGLTVSTAPSVAAGATQTITTRLALAQTGDLTLSPGAGGASLVLHGGTGANSRLATAAGNLELSAAGQYVYPSVDNYLYLGDATHRHVAVYAVNGTIQTSSADRKQAITPLDPAACAQAVLDTDWVSFEYTPPPLHPGPPGETPNQSSARVKAHSRMVQETAPARKQRGFVLGSAQHRVSDLFGLSDRQSTNASSDLAVVAAALQNVLTRLAQLEGA